MASGSRDQEASMRGVILGQFGAELAYKEGELSQIEDRIRLAKLMLQRLRMGVLAQHYGAAGFYPSELDYSQENIGAQSSWDMFEQGVLKGSEVKDEPSEELDIDADSKESTPTWVSNSPEDKGAGEVTIKEEPMDTSKQGDGPLVNHQDNFVSTTDRVQPVCLPPSHDQTTMSCDQNAVSCDQESRFYRKKRIIVGNTSQYLDPSSQCGGSTHKWMAYVRGSQAEPDISHFVKAVRFFLHPSYHPHDIILVNKPPFHLTKLGWGEFPVRVQLEFVDGRNKPVDIIHNLLLDRTHTGHQTLGAETVVDLDLSLPGDKGTSLVMKQSKESTRGCAPNGISLPLVNGLDDDLAVSETREITTTETNETSPQPISVGAVEDFPSLDNEIKLTEESEMEVGVSQEAEPSAARCCVYIPKSHRPRKPDSPVIVSHISLPLDPGSPDSISLDHDYCTTVVTIRPPPPSLPEPSPSLSRESSVPDSDKAKSESSPSQVLTTNLDKCLHLAVRSIPLYGRPSPNDGFLLSATSLAQFQSWSVGRRRASEWMRGVAIRRHVERQLKIPAILTTKQVVQWCRRNGYTPLDAVVNGSESGFCKCCGCQLHVPQEVGVVNEDGAQVVSSLHKKCLEQLKQDGASTLTQPYPCLAEVFTMHDKISREEQQQELNRDVNIETTPTPLPTPPTTSENDSIPRFRIPQTPELKWIQQTAAGIGIKVYPAVIDRMYAHVVEHMIYMSCARFLRSILIQATQEAGQGVEGELSRERVITPRHIHLALGNLESCDFVTGKSLGVEGGSDSDSSSSDSDSD